MAVTFESMERRMPKIEKCLAEYGIANLEEQDRFVTIWDLTLIRLLKTFSLLLLKTQAGLTLSAAQ